MSQEPVLGSSLSDLKKKSSKHRNALCEGVHLFTLLLLRWLSGVLYRYIDIVGSLVYAP